jgi:hypothetical protein
MTELSDQENPVIWDTFALLFLASLSGEYLLHKKPWVLK